MKFKNQVIALFSNAVKTNKVYSIKQLVKLQELVQHYFNYVLKEGQPYVDTVRLTHNGFFKADLKKDFIKITASTNFDSKTAIHLQKENFYARSL